MKKLSENKTLSFSFEEIVDEMIISAWYMVSEYHLNLGPSDGIEAVVNYIAENYHFKPNERRELLGLFLSTTKDKTIISYKNILRNNVPYRLQAPFLSDFTTQSWKGGAGSLIKKINSHEGLIYKIGELNGLQTKIHIDPLWADYLMNNSDVVKGWIEYNLVTYLQKRNPNVPGIINKLDAPADRELNEIKKYWKAMMQVTPVKDIYSKEIITKGDLSIDHFVPWSYVSHDEFWNLLPTFKAVNSSKSNNLPDWDRYFIDFKNQQYESFKTALKYDKLHKHLNECLKSNLNDDNIRFNLFNEDISDMEFTNRLKEIVLPVYSAAKMCGFSSWICSKENINE